MDEHWAATRREATSVSGHATMDWMHLLWRCPRCERGIADKDVRSAGSVLYRDFDELEKLSKQAWAVVAVSKPPRCVDCDVEATCEAADYHVFHGGRGHDLVFRWLPDAERPTLWWCDFESYTPAELGGMERVRLSIDAAVRRAVVKLEIEGVEAALADLLMARMKSEGDGQLLVFVEPLIAADRREMAIDVLGEYGGQHPEDEGGAMWLDELAS